MVEKIRKNMIEYYDKNFIKIWKNIFESYKNEENTLYIAGPSSYIFSLSSERFAIDLQIRRQKDFEALSDSIIRDTASLSYILITHEHDDHLCLPLMNILKNTDIHWYIPSKCRKELIESTGISEEKITWVNPGDIWKCGNVEFKAFYTPHGIQGTNFCFQCGYEITSPDIKILVPGDIRDYSYNSYPDFKKVDLCLAHLWGGNDALSSELYMPILNDFSMRIASFNAKKYYINHLYEIAREEKYLWTKKHAAEAKKLIKQLLPDSNIEIPPLGEHYSLKL